MRVADHHCIKELAHAERSFRQHIAQRSSEPREHCAYGEWLLPYSGTRLMGGMVPPLLLLASGMSPPGLAAPPTPAQLDPVEMTVRLIQKDGADNPAKSVGEKDHHLPLSGTSENPGSRDDGIDLRASFSFEAAANVAGGMRKKITESDQLVLAATVDTERAVGLAGGTFQATITYRHGKELGAVAGLGTLQQVQEVYGRGQTWRLTQFWYLQTFADGTADIKLGRLTQGEDFGNFSCDFLNLTFCGTPAGNLVGDYWYNWPISQWAARVKVKSGPVYAMAGAYENNPRNLDKSFTIGHFRGATGVLVPVEIGYNARRGSAGLPGTYKLGAWYNSSDGDDVRLGNDRQPMAATGWSPLRRNGRYGVYLQLQQQLSGRARETPSGPVTLQGLTIFLNLTQTDRWTSRTDNQIAAGLTYIGLLEARPKDQLGFAIGRTNVNGRASPGPAALPPVPTDAEYVAELDYGVHLTDAISLRPNFQYIVNPGGDRAASDIVVVGLKGVIEI